VLQALVFDLDGTLVDTEELHRQAFNQAFRELGLGWDWGPALYGELLSVSGGPDRIARYVDRLRVAAAEKARLRRLVAGVHRSKTRIYGELLSAGQAPARPGVRRLIREARAAGIAIGIAATSASANVQPLVRAALGPEAGAIAALVCADQVARRKPAPDLYERLLATLRVSAPGSVAFEDSANGLAAAKAAGLHTVAAPSRWTAGQDLRGADLLLPDLGELDLAQLQRRLPVLQAVHP